MRKFEFVERYVRCKLDRQGGGLFRCRRSGHRADSRRRQQPDRRRHARGHRPIIHASAPASMAATASGSDSVIIGCMSLVSPFHLMARPEIKQPSDLSGKKAGISAFS